MLHNKVAVLCAKSGVSRMVMAGVCIFMLNHGRFGAGVRTQRHLLKIKLGRFRVRHIGVT